MPLIKYNKKPLEKVYVELENPYITNENLNVSFSCSHTILSTVRDCPLNIRAIAPSKDNKKIAFSDQND